MARRIYNWILFSLLYVGCVSLTPTPDPPKRTLYDEIRIEFLSTPGCEVSDKDWRFFLTSLANYYCASNKISVKHRSLSDSFLPEDKVWNGSLLRSLEKEQRTLLDQNPGDRNLRIFVLSVPGKYKDRKMSNLSGVRYNPTSFALFYQNTPKELIGSVMLHEFGHISGLVGQKELGRRQQRAANPSRPDHCNNPKCVMFWLITVADAGLDSDCLEALKQAL